MSALDPPVPAEAGEHRRWVGLHGAARSLAIVQAARRHPRPVLVIAASVLEAVRFADEARFFGAGDGALPLVQFPDWETLPYDRFSAYQDIVSERLEALWRLPELRGGVAVCAATTLMHRLAPAEYVESHTLVLRAGERLPRERFCARLVRAGYRAVSQVIEHGDFATRGSLIDLYPMGSTSPYRIDWLDEEIDSLREFDPETQRSVEPVTEVRVLPARELPLDEAGIAQFRASWRRRFDSYPTDCGLYRDVIEGLAPGGVEYYLPMFFEAAATFFDYLPPGTLVVLDAGARAALHAFWEEVCARYESGRHDRERPLLPPAEVFLSPEELVLATGGYPAVELGGLARADAAGEVRFATNVPVRLSIDARAAEPLGLLKRYVGSFDGRVLFLAESKGRRETLSELFRQHGLGFTPCSDWPAFLAGTAPVGLTVAPLEQGASLEVPRIAILCEAQLFGERVRQERRRSRAARDPEGLIRDLTELSVGAPVVHERHGIGRYLGLFVLESGGVKGEYLGVEYADGDRLYVPVLSLHLITRYSGMDGAHAPLHKLGSGQWQRARARAEGRVRDVAAELLEIYARRAARQGHAFPLERDPYEAFVQGFPFEETPDQESAIAAVLADLQSERPMDRLVCGDVGFGKTEVAMRAAFVAALGGRQVAVLVPTTLLAQQHYQNFKDRLADWPLRLELLSRFQGKKEQERIVEGLRDGTVDIVIGTHKLLQGSVGFRRLGLLIIDEEHRFGVRQKERLKSLRSEVDVLTLTATPIPRTLNLALSATRDLSIIATPPARRIAIKTFVTEWDGRLIREALARELSRGGQVYILHNEIETIEEVARKLEALVPEARVRIAHGQMRERELEAVMLDFYHRRFHCLVCTTIIESGIDVPSANTIVVNRADKFGLAQLYQLRGRVGRSHHRAYAYLIVPSLKVLRGDALKRLEAIASMEELGVGFTLATHDLEIRGAGEILGAEQSGHIQEVGFGLYTELLRRAVAALKAGRQPELDRPLDHGAEVELHIPCLIPEEYLPDVHTRLILYKRIASAPDPEALVGIEEELVDRFGPLPPPAKDLFRVTRLKLRAQGLGVKKIDLGPSGGRVLFGEEAPIDPQAVVALVQRHSGKYRFEPGHKIRIAAALPDAEARVQALDALFEQLNDPRKAMGSGAG